MLMLCPRNKARSRKAHELSKKTDVFQSFRQKKNGQQICTSNSTLGYKAGSQSPELWTPTHKLNLWKKAGSLLLRHMSFFTLFYAVSYPILSRSMHLTSEVLHKNSINCKRFDYDASFFAMIPIQSTARSRKYLKDILYIYLLYIYFEIRKIRLIQALPCANKNQNKSSPVTSRSPITLAVSLLFSFFSIFCCCCFN